MRRKESLKEEHSGHSSNWQVPKAGTTLACLRNRQLSSVSEIA